MTYEEMAKLVASKLSREELIELATMLDEDARNLFCFCIQAETAKVAPELYGDKPLEKFATEVRKAKTPDGPWSEPLCIAVNTVGPESPVWSKSKPRKRGGWEQRRVVRRKA
jgi:hypothetical protein